MSDAQSVRLQLNDIEMRRTSSRQAPIQSFGTVLHRGMITGLQTAGYALPGAAVVSAALSGYGIPKDADNPQAGGNLAAWGGSGSGSEVGANLGNPMAAVAKRAAGGDSSAEMMMATHHMQEMNNQMNMQYLQMQQTMQRDSREFTMISNIMKTKHDTARNSLSNLK